MSTSLFPRLNALALAIALVLPNLAFAQAQPTPPAPDGSDGSQKPKNLEAVTVTGVPLGQSAEEIIAPVAVLSGEELDIRKANTLGETVSSIPGVSTTYFGPGVGRPVIRGLDGSRVAILSDGLGSDDVSNVSQDHAVAIEPFLADQIEVLKGPATLLYGSGAIGGVVNTVDGRIRETALDEPLGGRAELRYDAGAHGFTGMSRVDAGTDEFLQQPAAIAAGRAGVVVLDHAPRERATERWLAAEMFEGVAVACAVRIGAGRIRLAGVQAVGAQALGQRIA